MEPYGKRVQKNNLINMSNIKDNLLQLIGKTPLVRLSNIYKDEYGTEIIAKVEYFNPGGSVKDRAAYAMIEAAETSGKLKKMVQSLNLQAGIPVSVWLGLQP